MESISQLVESSLARHGVPANFDHLRLQWSNWFRCESSFSVLLAPAKPGILALGEEIVPPAESVGKRMLALFHIAETDDLGMALGRLFLPGNPLRERLAEERCFARYAVIEDPLQRQTATVVFKRWMQESSEIATGIGNSGAGTPARDSVFGDTASTISRQSIARESVSPKSQPSTSFAWGMEVQEREVSELKRPQPLPNGF